MGKSKCVYTEKEMRSKDWAQHTNNFRDQEDEEEPAKEAMKEWTHGGRKT